MSQHPSLRIGGKIRMKRNVMKRYERIDTLKAANKWKEGENSPYGLPKTKPVE